jgi:hypothetical protein
MNPAAADPKRTLEYGHSHEMATKALPWTLGAIAMGLFLMSEPTGKADEKGWMLGALVIAIALAFLAALIYRRTQPSVPDLVVSEQGILFRSLSAKIIPWDEIRAVKRDLVSGTKDFLSTRVVRLEVSPQFYERLVEGRWLENVVGESGDPSAVYLAYHLDAPHDELYAAVHLRWRAFSRYGEAAAPADTRSAYDNLPLAGSTARATPRRGRVIERASSFEGVRALGGLFAGGGIATTLGNVVALGLIIALLSNILGLWATDAQLKGRAEAAKWKAWHEERDREQAQFDAEQKKIREKFDRMFACMNETFERRDHGIPGDPECAKGGK